jgi:hypothetical protein
MKTAGIRNTAEILATPDTYTNVVLAAGLAQAFDVPSGAGIVAFSFNTDFWVKYGSTGAQVPTTSQSSASSSGSELNPTIRNFGSTLGCTGISIVSAIAGAGSLCWFEP